MTDKLAAVPTEPADNDVVVWEPYDKGSDREAGPPVPIIGETTYPLRLV